MGKGNDLDAVEWAVKQSVQLYLRVTDRWLTVCESGELFAQSCESLRIKATVSHHRIMFAKMPQILINIFMPFFPALD